MTAAAAAKRKLGLLRETFQEWKDDDALQWGAALAYYSIFSIAPLLLVTISVAGLLFGRDAVEGRLVAEISGVVGAQAAAAIQTMVANASRTGSGVWGTIVGVGLMLLGASGAFAHLQKSLNHLWNVEPKPDAGWRRMVRQRLAALGMVLVVALLLLIALVLSAAVGAVASWAEDRLPMPGWALSLVDLAVSLAVVTLLFAAIYKVLPDVEIEWRDVWLGAAATAFLFALGKLAIGFYLGHSSVASSYGAAGSLVVLLVWIFYSTQLVFFGAELTQVWARRRGRRIQPAEWARRVQEVAVPPEGDAA
ncbi:MAG TPA: YihY/virulence factor BrkB family protein [Thermoanaerobaculia bacterium]